MEEGLAFKIRQNNVYKDMEMQTNLAFLVQGHGLLL